MKPRRFATKTLVALILSLALFAGNGFAADKLASTALRKLATSAKTPADYTKLAKHYEAVAAEHEAEAKEHEALAEVYAKAPTGKDQKHPMSAQTVGHCKTYAEHCRKLAQQARAMAADYAGMAKQAGH
ncbi:MAG: hypothetical protein HY820_12965 [Acidobacteria bacterium]|nr:hypothetical protein [Acidobacteriota bacterium]